MKLKKHYIWEDKIVRKELAVITNDNGDVLSSQLLYEELVEIVDSGFITESDASSFNKYDKEKINIKRLYLKAKGYDPNYYTIVSLNKKSTNKKYKSINDKLGIELFGKFAYITKIKL